MAITNGCQADDQSNVGDRAAENVQRTPGAAQVDAVPLSPRASVFVVKNDARFHMDGDADRAGRALKVGDTLEVISGEGPELRIRKGDVSGRIERTAVEPVAGAWSVFNDRIREDPKDAVWLAGRGSVLASLAHLSAAEKDLRAALEQEPNLVIAHGRLGDVMAQMGKYDDAIHHYDQAFALNAKSGYYATRRGVCRTEMRAYADAHDDFRQAIELPDDRAQALIERSVLHLAQKSFDEAIADCSAALTIHADLPEAYFRRAEAFLAQHKSREAIADLIAGSKLRPGYLVSEISKYQHLVENILEEDADNVTALTALAFAQDRAADTKSARDTIDTLLRIGDDNSLGWLQRGLILHRLDDHAQAIQAFDHAARLGIQWSHLSLCRGRSRRAVGQLALALQDFDKAAQIDPTRVESWMECLDAREQSGQPEAAAAIAEIAVRAGGGGHYAYVARGRMRLQRGLVEQSIADAETALGYWAFSGEAHLLRLEATARSVGDEAGSGVANPKDANAAALSAKVDRLLRHLENSSSCRNVGSYRIEVLRELVANARHAAPPPRVDIEEIRSPDLNAWYQRLARPQTLDDQIKYNLSYAPFSELLKAEPDIEAKWLENVRAVLPAEEYELALRTHALRERITIPFPSVSHFRNADQLRQARQVAERLVAAHPADMRLKLLQGDVLRAQLEPQAAVDVYNQVIENEPRAAAALLGRAYANLRRGEVNLAASDFKKYVDLGGPVAPDDADNVDQRQRRRKLVGVLKLAIEMAGQGNQELIAAEFADPPPIVLIQNQDGTIRTSMASLDKYADFVGRQERDVVGAISLKLMADDLVRVAANASEQFLPTDLATAAKFFQAREFIWGKP